MFCSIDRNGIQLKIFIISIIIHSINGRTIDVNKTETKTSIALTTVTPAASVAAIAATMTKNSNNDNSALISIKNDLKIYKKNLLNDTVLKFLNQCYSIKCCTNGDNLLCPSYFEYLRLFKINNVLITDKEFINLQNNLLNSKKMQTNENNINEFCSNLSNHVLPIVKLSSYKFQHQHKQEQIIHVMNDTAKCKLLCTQIEWIDDNPIDSESIYKIKPMCMILKWMYDKMNFNLENSTLVVQQKSNNINNQSPIASSSMKQEKNNTNSSLHEIETKSTAIGNKNVPISVVDKVSENEQKQIQQQSPKQGNGQQQQEKQQGNQKSQLNEQQQQQQSKLQEQQSSQLETSSANNNITSKNQGSQPPATVTDASIEPNNRDAANKDESNINLPMYADNEDQDDDDNIEQQESNNNNSNNDENLTTNNDDVFKMKTTNNNGVVDDDNPTYKKLSQQIEIEQNNKLMEQQQQQQQIVYEKSNVISIDPFYEESDGSNFLLYFLIIFFICIILYVLYQNKSKILALLIEGGRHRSVRSQKLKNSSCNKRKSFNGAGYKRLDTNLEEAITSSSNVSSGHQTATQIIY